MIIAMSKLVDRVPTEQEVEHYARDAYMQFARNRVEMTGITSPLWEYTRRDIKSFWVGIAQATLSFYAYQDNPVEE